MILLRRNPLNDLTRRHMLGSVIAGASGIMAGTALQGCKNQPCPVLRNVIGDPRVQGPFPILSTPFTASGNVDFDVLARQARFVEWCDSPGMIWPQSGDSVDLLTANEKLSGTEGLITERAVYADLMTAIWERMQNGSDPDGLADAFGKLLLMLNLRETIPGNQLRGYHLYVWKKHGVFKNMLSRNYGPKNSIPASPILSEQALTQEDIDEIESRFAALKPYLKRNSFAG